ncbi:immunoglobulin lambda-1 light chain-like [Polyodon spathula]|uniref:immunoglobulin lambda-1 light chain-like n=1 Tax=Polyodon spathula TaxID=7913 RepID=UPI001B7F5A3A|nr:immunoglobulin lambda-1 light chain-like [Polyodon spathula]
MLTLSCICALLACIAGVDAQPVLTQTSSVSVSPGQSAQILCTMSDGYVITGYWVNWYQQKHGSTPRYLLRYKSNSEKDSAAPDRFFASKDTAGNACHLTISSVEADDYADYYCGTPSSPSLSLLGPSSDELQEKRATLVCLVQHFFPYALSVSWKVDGSVTAAGVKTGKPQQRADNSFDMSSYLILSESEWIKHKNFACEVTHQTLSTPASKSFNKSDCF